MLAWFSCVDRTYLRTGHIVGTDPSTRPDPRFYHSTVDSQLTTRQAGYVPMSRWRRHGHQLSSQWTTYIVLNTQNLDHGTTMEFRQYTGSFGLRRMQLLTGPAVRVSRDVRRTLKILFTELPNQGL